MKTSIINGSEVSRLSVAIHFAEGVSPHYTKGFEVIKRGKAALFVLSHRAFSASESPIGAPNCKPQ
ncbi:hypothetical protein, partial [Enterobacter hormaechei]|uniref:hypothetical protein n=1 Tax=Enterobacter hormaechei TaxID=158836 RepID=UPI000A88B28B